MWNEREFKFLSSLAFPICSGLFVVARQPREMERRGLRVLDYGFNCSENAARGSTPALIHFRKRCGAAEAEGRCNNRPIQLDRVVISFRLRRNEE